MAQDWSSAVCTSQYILVAQLILLSQLYFTNQKIINWPGEHGTN